MASVINTNIFSLVAQRNLSTSQGSLQTSITRLSSGLRINSAADDAAGLAITDRMTAQVNGLTQAQRNANDGISLVQTAAGALSSITDNLQRIRTLAVQATNATNSDSDRAALDQEVQQRLAEINRTASQTQFNGLSVLNGTMGVANFQVGANAGQTISVNLTQSMTTSSIGAVATANSTTNPLSFTVAAGALTIQDGAGTAQNVAAGTYNNANDLAAAITRFSLNLIRLYAVLSRPFLPDASDAMLAALGLESAEWPDDLLVALSTVPSGQPFTVPPVLFAKLDDARRSELEARFAGTAG